MLDGLCIYIFTKVFLFLTSNRTHLLVNQTGLSFLVPETFFFGTLAPTKEFAIRPSDTEVQNVYLSSIFIFY